MLSGRAVWDGVPPRWTRPVARYQNRPVIAPAALVAIPLLGAAASSGPQEPAASRLEGRRAAMRWGAEPFEKARREDRPVVLCLRRFASSECEAVESALSTPAEPDGDFILVAVDEDEQPAIASVYRAAAQARRRGPLVALLVPDGRPFDTLARPEGGIASGADSVRGFAERGTQAFRADRRSVEDSARRALEAARQVLLQPRSRPRPLSPAETRAALHAGSSIDASRIVLLAPRAGARRVADGDATALLDATLLERALESTARSAVRDHVGGGFFEGSVEGGPFSFEKRLAGNALLLRAFARRYAATSSLLQRDVARETVAWAVREMRDSSGAFWSSIDGGPEAGSDGYYVWRADEIKRALGPERSAELDKSYRLEPPGVLVLTGSPFAGLGESRQVLLSRRARRVRPATDGRVFAGSNGLMIGALAASGAAGWASDLEAARRAADAVLARLGPATRLCRCGRDPGPCAPALLEDHAFLAEGLLDLHEATGEERWRAEAVALVDAAVARFWDVEQGGFYETDARAEPPLLLRIKTARDAELPPGNAVLADVLHRLGKGIGAPRYSRLAEKTIEAFAEPLARDPSGYATLALVAEQWRGRSGPSR